MRDYLGKKIINFGVKLSKREKSVEWIIPDASEFERSVIETASHYTSTTPVAQWAFIQAIKDVHKRAVPGDLVECGVWKGGNLLIAALMKQHLAFDRKIIGYDTFAGMTEPSEFDVKPGFKVDASEKFNKLKQGKYVNWCYVPKWQVAETLREHCEGVSVELVEGDVANTLRDEKNLPETISVLRLDTDFYESTKLELEILYPRVSSGGIVIVDDYGVWKGSRRAIHEYFGDEMPWLHYINRGVRLFIKS